MGAMRGDREEVLEKRRRFLINFAYFSAVAALIWFGLKYAIELALPFLLGLAAALTLKPAADALSARLRIRKRPMAIAVTSVCCFAAVGALCLAGVFAVNSARRLILLLPRLYSEDIAPAFERLEALIQRFLPSEAAGWLDYGLRAAGRQLGSALLGRSAQALSELPSVALTLTSTMVFSLFICADYGRVTGFLARLIPERHRHWLFESKAALLRALSRMLGAQLALIFTSFAILFTAFALLGLGDVAGKAALTALLDALPGIGTGIILIPWALLELLRGNSSLGAGLLITFGIVTVVRGMLEPRLLGGRTAAGPVASLLAMYAGLRLFGFAGMLLAPLALNIVSELYGFAHSSRR